MADEEGEDENQTYYDIHLAISLLFFFFFGFSQQGTETGSAGKLPCLDGDRERLT